MISKELRSVLVIAIALAMSISFCLVSASTIEKVTLDSQWESMYSSINSQSISDEERIKSIVELYINMQYDELTVLKHKDINFMILYNKEMKEESILRKIHIKKLEKMKERYFDYKINLDFSNIAIVSDVATVDVTVSCDWHYASTPNELSRMGGDGHTIKLVKVDGIWKISEDLYESNLKIAIKNSGISPEEFYSKVEKNEDSINTSHKYVSKNIPDLSKLVVSGTYYTYARAAAKSYSDTYDVSVFNSTYYGSGSPDTANGGKFYNFKSLGGDCTNFASQVIHAGGVPFDKSGSYKWYYDNANSRLNWTGVEDLWNYCVNNYDYDGSYGVVAYGTDVTNLGQGDIIQLNLYSDHFGHSIVVWQGNSDPYYIKVSAHSGTNSSRWLENVNLGQEYGWSDIRGIRISGYCK